MKRAPVVSTAAIGAFLADPPPPAEVFDWSPAKRERPHGNNARGKARDRRRRKQWLLDTFGDGEIVQCVHCPAWLDFETVTVDRIVPGCEGGRYTRDNIQPSCVDCAHRQGNAIATQRRQRLVS